MSLRIHYTSRGFPRSMTFLNGGRTLVTSWDDLLWAAITVGRPNRQFVFRHGRSSIYEALFRLSLVRMAVEEQRWGNLLKRTDAVRTLDPTEKGAVNYFLGLVISKLFADALLETPWMLHLDVFRPTLNAQLVSRSRPDLVGRMRNGRWIVMECKGRANPPDAVVKARAKQQATRLVRIDGVAPAYHIGGITFFRDDTLEYHWEDPPAEESLESFELDVPGDSWRQYYDPILQLVSASPGAFEQMREQDGIFVPIPEADVEVSIRPDTFRLITSERWPAAPSEIRPSTAHDPYHGDGIAVRAGPTWNEPFDEGEG